MRNSIRHNGDLKNELQSTLLASLDTESRDSEWPIRFAATKSGVILTLTEDSARIDINNLYCPISLGGCGAAVAVRDADGSRVIRHVKPNAPRSKDCPILHGDSLFIRDIETAIITMRVMELLSTDKRTTFSRIGVVPPLQAMREEVGYLISHPASDIARGLYVSLHDRIDRDRAVSLTNTGYDTFGSALAFGVPACNVSPEAADEATFQFIEIAGLDSDDPRTRADAIISGKITFIRDGKRMSPEGFFGDDVQFLSGSNSICPPGSGEAETPLSENNSLFARYLTEIIGRGITEYGCHKATALPLVRTPYIASRRDHHSDVFRSPAFTITRMRSITRLLLSNASIRERSLSEHGCYVCGKISAFATSDVVCQSCASCWWGIPRFTDDGNIHFHPFPVSRSIVSDLRMRKMIGEAIACMVNGERVPAHVYSNFQAFGTLVSNKNKQRGHSKAAQTTVVPGGGEKAA